MPTMRPAASLVLPLAALLVAGAACRESARGTADGAAPRGAEVAAVPDVPAVPPAGVVRLAAVANLGRYPGLEADHRARLERDGLFLAPTSARAAFLLYERNERVGLPNYVTPELAVDLLLAAWGAVVREVEANHAAPALYRALHALVVRGLELRRLTLGDGADVLLGLDRTIALLAVAAHLLGAEGARPEPEAEPEPEADPNDDVHAEAGRTELLVPLPEIPWPALPPTCDAMFQEAVSRIRVAAGVFPIALLNREVDFSRFRLADAAAEGRPRALHRALLWLELSAPATAADLADPVSGPLLVRLLADAVAGDEPAADLWNRATRLLAFVGRTRPGLDPLAAAGALRASVGEEGALPRTGGASVRAVLALPDAPPRGMLGLVPGGLAAERCPGCDDVAQWLGPAMLDPDLARRLDAFPTPDEIPRGRARVRPEAWAALPRTWVAERDLVLSGAPSLPAPAPFPDCVPAGAETPHGAVAPVPVAFRSVSDVAETLAAELRSLGVLPERELETPVGPAQTSAYLLQEVLRSVAVFGRAFADLAALEVAGEPWSDTQIVTVAGVGGWAESILADALHAEAAAPADGRRARRRAGRVEGLGGLDVLYVVIDTPDGPVLARGAMRAVYGDLDWPFAADTFGDEAWRTWIEADPPPPRPAWLAPLVAAPVPPPPVVGEGNRRCLGPDSGGDLEL
ncbi:MAG: DUF3160 domain-containing protein [Deltaproteobacteria bacterium]|nr:DUF3160 domain-containing protein [Deltaproteobacteria bacterium]